MNYNDDSLARVNQIFNAMKHWIALRDIPINDEDEIEEDFIPFSKGTSRFEIWRWIEDTYKVDIERIRQIVLDLENLR